MVSLNTSTAQKCPPFHRHTPHNKKLSIMQEL